MASVVTPRGRAANPKIPGYKRKLLREMRRLHKPVAHGFNVNAPWNGKACQWTLGVYQHAMHLPETHRFDDATCFALDHPPVAPIKMTRREHATRIALSFEGVHEQPMGSNRGDFVVKFIRAGNNGVFPGPEPWCADFVTYCEEGAGVTLPSFYKPNAFNWLDQARKGRGLLRVVTLDQAVRGDLVIFTFSHIGRFLSHATLPNGPAVHTIDGNTSDQVAQRVRPAGLVLGCVRIVNPA